MANLRSISLLDKFTGENYSEYDFQLNTLARMLGSQGILDGTEEIPTSPPEKIKEYNKRRDELHGAIVFSQSPQTSKLVRNAEPKGCPRAAYLALCAAYRSTTSAAIQQQAIKLTTMQQGEGSELDLITNINEAADRLDTAIKQSTKPLELLDVLKLAALIQGLNPIHESIKDVLLLKPDLDYKAACAIVLERSERLKTSLNNEGTSAMTARYHKNGRHSFQSNKPTTPCSKCLEKGKTLYHWQSDCFILHPEKAPAGWIDRSKHAQANNAEASAW
jgi:hypothetical protein